MQAGRRACEVVAVARGKWREPLANFHPMTSRQTKDALPIEAELWAERASTLSRVTEQFEATLERYKVFASTWQQLDEAARTPEQRAQHSRLESAAAQALWHLVIQREALGLRSHADLMQIYAVPPNIRRKMGPAKG